VRRHGEPRRRHGGELFDGSVADEIGNGFEPKRRKIGVHRLPFPFFSENCEAKNE
jgi:hypothetical protein